MNLSENAFNAWNSGSLLNSPKGKERNHFATSLIRCFLFFLASGVSVTSLGTISAQLREGGNCDFGVPPIWMEPVYFCYGVYWCIVYYICFGGSLEGLITVHEVTDGFSEIADLNPYVS